MNIEKTWKAKLTSFINRQPTWLFDTIAIFALFLIFLTKGYLELFFIALGLVSSFIGVTRSMKASMKDRPDEK
jgi:hypothetical protein